MTAANRNYHVMRPPQDLHLQSNQRATGRRMVKSDPNRNPSHSHRTCPQRSQRALVSRALPHPAPPQAACSSETETRGPLGALPSYLTGTLQLTKCFRGSLILMS